MSSYRAAGVDLEGAERHVSSITTPVTSTWNERVIGSFGGFAAGVTMPTGYRNPVLMLTTDGVGTKLDLARRTGKWEGVGFDLVAMVVDDLAAVGAAPLGLVDYLAVGALNPTRDLAIIDSIARACVVAGCPLLGGETAEHPEVMPTDQVDLAATALGVVEQGSEWGPHRVQVGDVVVGLFSPNLRSNGFSLVRAVIEDRRLDLKVGDSKLADLLLEPSVIYSPTVLALKESNGVHAAAHITGGGLESNLSRVIPPGLRAVIDYGSWDAPPVFAMMQEWGDVSNDEMLRTFNMGIGFCLVAPPDTVPGLTERLGGTATVIGRVE
ncbi:MAG TPA: phosphoribosylformylglycinamidine cyclo-ligase [Acidimicrobiia bacterium]|nr:phosphoribosylformylglycinamidine cyclo-ligase [Acidimicrobiia bacterium]